MSDVQAVAEAFIAYYSRGGGCSNCGGLPHSSECFVGRFQAALARVGVPPQEVFTGHDIVDGVCGDPKYAACADANTRYVKLPVAAVRDGAPQEDQRAFVEALLDPPAPGAALTTAAHAYREPAARDGAIRARLNIRDALCVDCGAPLVWSDAWQGADCVVCVRQDRDGLEEALHTTQEEFQRHMVEWNMMREEVERLRGDGAIRARLTALVQRQAHSTREIVIDYYGGPRYGAGPRTLGHNPSWVKVADLEQALVAATGGPAPEAQTQMAEPSEKPEECDCCDYETAALESYRPNVGARSQRERWLCRLCAGTMTSTYDEYPEQHDHDALALMKTVCYVGNAILDALAVCRRAAPGADPQP